MLVPVFLLGEELLDISKSYINPLNIKGIKDTCLTFTDNTKVFVSNLLFSEEREILDIKIQRYPVKHMLPIDSRDDLAFVANPNSIKYVDFMFELATIHLLYRSPVYVKKPDFFHWLNKINLDTNRNQ